MITNAAVGRQIWPYGVIAPRARPITGPILVAGAAVKGERSESAGHGAERSALDGRDGDQTIPAE
jgi:hypothetical protein